MTKRRPSWSDRLRWAAATLVGGLLLLSFTVPAQAAVKKASAVNVSQKAKMPPKKLTAAVRSGKTSGQKPRGQHKAGKTAGKTVAGRALDESVGLAEVRPDDMVGLRGSASFYGHGFQGRRAANGERFDVRAFTAASNHFPLGTMVAVRRLDNELCAIVRINDRMGTRHRRIIDVSRGVAEYLDMLRSGVVLVRVAPLKSSERAARNCHAAFEATEPCPGCSPQLGLSGGMKTESDFSLP